MAQNTISDELNRLIQAKADIKAALEDKGVVIGESSTLDEYPALIQEMQTGGGGYDTSTIIDLIERDYSGNFVIPNGTTKIGSYGLAFLPITGVSIPNTVTSIDSNGFYFCSNLKKLILPNSIINIGGNAFSSMTNYDIVIPESVTNINNTAFSNGNGGKITFLGLTPPTVQYNLFYNLRSIIYVKNNALQSYKSKWNSNSSFITPLASMDYDSTTYTVTALGRDNLELYVDASLINSSVYTFTPGNADASHVITVTSTDPSLGLLDTSTLEVLVPADVTNKDYMCLTCVDENGGTIGGWDPYVETQDSSVSDIYYSSDKRNWTLWNKTYSNDSHSYTYDTINMNENDALYFKATGLGNPQSNSDYFNFTMSGEMEGSGNAMSLLYGDNFENQTAMPARGLYRTFNNCSTLTTAPDLPATVLNTICYYRIFDGCRNLSYINAQFIDTYDTSIEGVVWSATYNWVKNVSTNGTFVKNPDAIWDVSGVFGVPAGWTIEGWTPPAPAGQTFVKVTSADQLADGKKCIIVYDDVAMGSWKETETGNHDDDFSGISVTAGNEIDISNTETSDPETPGWVLSIDVLTLKSISNNQYNLQYDNGNYIYSNRQGTSLTASSTPFVWNITNQDNEGNNFNYFAIQHSITDYVYINSTGEPDFGCFVLNGGNHAMLYVEKTT